MKNYLSAAACIALMAPLVLVPQTAAAPVAHAATAYELATEEAQTFHVSEAATPQSLVRGSYSATTPAEIAERKAAEEAARLEAERLAEEAKRKEEAKKLAQASQATKTRFAALPTSGLSCSPTLCWPLASYTFNPSINGYRTASRPNHMGFDMLAPAMSPIVSVAEGTVRTSSESLGGFGVAVVVDSVIDGQSVSMTYGHMTYGSRQVQAGDKVAPGQLLGGVGTTGNSTANHLHIEIRVNGSTVDPQEWLHSHIG